MMTRRTVKVESGYSSVDTNYGSGRQLTPHELYMCMAIDAVLVEFDQQLPDDDEGYSLLTSVANHAAWATLRLANIPDDWFDFVANLPGTRDKAIRHDIANLLWKLAPPQPKVIDETKSAAIERIRALCDPSKYDELQTALLSLDQAYVNDSTQSAEHGFRLGYEIARDPSRLIYETAGE